MDLETCFRRKMAFEVMTEQMFEEFESGVLH
jgi:hypothetical protein